ncbi:hypothetical protein [uncultured Methanobrevibacter sp.]|uniref:DNA replication complex subunit Gins51 n=1 Tax=uncultured Methanobrevibacter sp. TaxID=253161 RepID=UPI0025F736DE|nr:hypothetical protein [uncultured Methanobrevibacter sp.]
MDQFYQELRKIQKKERNNGTLARVEEDFYASIHEYLDELRQEAMRDPFSNVHGMLKEAQIIATEICERREHKITDAAVVNIHRSYHLFTGKPKFDLIDTTPLNLTPEEEKFYFSLIDTLKNHRGNISLEKLSDDEDKVIKPKDVQTNTLISPDEVKPKVSAVIPSDEEPKDEVLERLDEISRAKVIPQEPPKPKIEPKDEVLERLDEISRAKVIPQEPPKPKVAPAPKPPAKKAAYGSIEDNPNAFDEQDEFYDLESKKLARDTELVTMLVFDDVGSIVGVDEKIYGPFRPQDLVTLPLINAKIFFKNRKGRQVKI